MSRNTGSTWKKSRRLGFSILETGEELTRRNYVPGQHGQGRRGKLTNYGIQLQEKQRIRHTYQLSEKQFANTYAKASKKPGASGENLLVMLESRLDNIVYRMGFARTRRAARQLVNHGHILVDGKKVDIPSFQVKPGQEIEVRERSKNLSTINEALEAATSTVDFVNVDADKKKGTYVRYPERSELFTSQPINELLVVEYYNR
ncbi:MAG: 30S ribosomal protein S4 [Absicoccus porci]|jgi:small subunit ribosomal protein S4|uniref:Small ribosomal subunit protein uS4 n=1 Tax=Absicoccus porci TaxID=2486576 RepID=A0A3N0HYC2_9FIRM|nr:30S ribosomal protein S4 [Absicoccus porci]MCI6088106.1 30S ribosomal protein S4 [Absicoccus porci]MDD6459814.1 30S ribosomal protein S4 [Absicoccus porci]MDD7329489.1 30S ribosomal protein S4 [Absicoccus porci]MDY4739163.1 30S ribosomal protein S4 [Absicoccus porci]MEE1355201.1 30S ribosomal protein S4 [Absicoccus porci]